MKKSSFSIHFVSALLTVVVCSCGGRGSGPGNLGTTKDEVLKIPSVEVTEALTREVSLESTYSATVEPYAVNNVAPTSPGRLRKLYVQLGDYVAKGQVLAEMDRLQLDQMKLQLQNNEAEFNRLKALYEKGGISKSDFETAELSFQLRQSSYDNLEENTILRSPISGFINAKNYEEGDLYSAARPLYTVEQVVPVKLVVGITEGAYSSVRKGDSVMLTADALPGRTFTGKINRIYPDINPATHTFSAEVLVQNTDRALHPGMYVRVNVGLGSRSSVVVPDQAVLRQEGTSSRYVYVLSDDGTVAYRSVSVGTHAGDVVEILSGLAEGERVVVKGQAALKDGAKVEVL